MWGEGVGEEARCLGVGKVCACTRGDWAAVNIEADAEGGGLGDEERSGTRCGVLVCESTGE